MARISKAVNDELYAKCQEELKKQGRIGAISRKLQAISSAKNNKIYIVCEVFGISKATLFKWIKHFDSDHTRGLVVKQGRGRKPLIGSNKEQMVIKILINNPTITARELSLIIYQKFNITISSTSTYRLIHKIGFNYITARKNHYKQDKSKINVFKKNFKH